MVYNTWTKTSLFPLSFDTIQSHIGLKVYLQYSFIFGHTAMKHPVCCQYVDNIPDNLTVHVALTYRILKRRILAFVRD